MLVEEIIIKYLNENMSVSAHTEKPENAPKRYILIDKTGSSKSNHLPSATIAFQSYAKSNLEAAKLNKELKDVVEQMIELDEIRGIELNSDYDFTDTTKKEYRYQAVFDIRYY